MLKCDTLVLVPGLLCNHHMWERQYEALKDHMQVVIANVRKDTSVKDMATRVLDTVTGNFAIAGLSMGGYVTLEVLAQGADRVSHFALMDTNAYADQKDATEKRKQAIALAEQDKFDQVLGALLPSILGERAIADTEILDTMKLMASDTGITGFIRQQKAIMARADHRENLKNYTQPSLILCGKEDVLTPPHVHYEMVEQLPNSDFQLLGDCGHMAPMERPNAVLSALINLMHR